MKCFNIISLFFLFFLFFSSAFVFAQEVSTLRGQQLIKLANSREFQVKFVGQPRCSVGDLDGISLEMRARENSGKGEESEVLFSLEALPKNKLPFAPQIASIMDDTGLAKNVITFNAPKVEDLTFAGIFICTHTKGRSRHCAGKPALPFGKVIDSYKVTVDPKTKLGFHSKGGEDISDKVWFFRYLIIGRDRIYFAKNAMDEKAYLDLEKQMSKVKASNFPQDSRRLKELSVLASEPLKLEGKNVIVVTLPFHNPGKCR